MRCPGRDRVVRCPIQPRSSCCSPDRRRKRNGQCSGSSLSGSIDRHLPTAAWVNPGRLGESKVPRTSAADQDSLALELSPYRPETRNRQHLPAPSHATPEPPWAWRVTTARRRAADVSSFAGRGSARHACRRWPASPGPTGPPSVPRIALLVIVEVVRWMENIPSHSMPLRFLFPCVKHGLYMQYTLPTHKLRSRRAPGGAHAAARRHERARRGGAHPTPACAAARVLRNIPG